ncbi:MAG TPA: DUF1302 family protein [Aliidongia sp.]|nr:DUF1302 family protein [Aliidongia sp.]
MSRTIRRHLRTTTACASVALAAGIAIQPALAFDFTIGDGWTGNLDTTISAGATVRTSSQDFRHFGGPATGNPNGTETMLDGDLNFRQGDLTSQPNRITEELVIKNGETTIFVRGTAFYDTVLATGSNADFRPLPHGSIDASGRAVRLLDAFVDQKFDMFGAPATVRIGNQVINWGESTFIQGGINTVAPIDATAAHSPGTELKDVILPIPAIDFKVSPFANVSFEAYYQFLNAHDLLDGQGTFLEANDLVSPGGRFIVEGSATTAPFLTNLNFVRPPDATFGRIQPQGSASDAHNLSDEAGFAARLTVPQLDDAEFGAYAETYASRTPFLNFRTGSAAGLAGNQAFLSSILAPGLFPPAPSISYTGTSSVSLTYPEHIHLIGGSFSFVGPDNLQFQGEVSHRFNQPILMSLSDIELIVDEPALCSSGGILGILGTTGPNSALCQGEHSDPVRQAIGNAPAGLNSTFNPSKRFPVSQVQASVTKLWNNIPGTPIGSTVLVAEAGLVYVHDFPKNAGLFQSQGTTGASAFSFEGVPLVGTSSGLIASTQLATQVSYGMDALATFDMPHTMPAGIDMTPSIAFSWGIGGNSPVGAGSFVAHAAQLGFNLNFSYLQNLQWGVGYVYNFQIGGNPFENTLYDRDFLSAFVSYSF